MPYDYSQMHPGLPLGGIPPGGQASALQNRQMVANALRAQSMGPIHTTPSGSGQISWAQTLGKVMGGYKAKREDRAIQEEQARIAQQQQADTQASMQQFMKDYHGFQNEDGSFTSGNPHQAIAKALMSGSETTAAHAKDYKDQMLTAKDIAERATDKSVVENPYRPQAWRGKSNLTTLPAGEVLLNEEGVSVPLEGVQPELESRDGALLQQTPTGWNQVNRAPTNSTNVTSNINITNPSEDAYGKALGSAQGKSVSEHMKFRDDATEGLTSINEALTLLDEGIFTGALSGVQKNIQKYSGAIFGSDTSKAARTEQYISQIGPLVLTLLQKLGGSDTENERRYLEGISAGTTELEEGAMRSTLQSVARKLRTRLDQTERILEANTANGREVTMPTTDTGVRTPIPSAYRKMPAGTRDDPYDIDTLLRGSP